MIIAMAKVRVLGERERMDDVLRALQDFGLLHLADAAGVPILSPPPSDPRIERHRRHARAALDDVEDALHLLGVPSRAERAVPTDAAALARWVRLARRLRREARALRDRATALDEERGLVSRYRDFLVAVLPVVQRVAGSPRLTSYAVVVPASASRSVDALAAALEQEVGAEFALTRRTLDNGDVAVLLVLPRTFAQRLEARLAEARVPEVPLPAAYAGQSLEQAVPAMIARLERIPAELDAIERERRQLARAHGPALLLARAALYDWLAQVEARRRCGVTAHAFAIEGWLPEPKVGELRHRLTSAFGPSVVVEPLAREDWEGEDAPVVLANPRLFRPFEKVLALLPLPRYGTIDPTPFVAIFFPLFFGMMLGDIGYGVVMAAIGLVLHRRSKPGTLVRAIAEIAGPCAVFAIIFGVLYGELFGDLGRHWFGLHALAFDREESVTAALALAIAIGAVHVLLGLVLGVVNAARHEPKHALGRGVSALMILLIIVALLAAVDVLPDRFFTPAIVTLLVAFPVLIFAEGMIAPVELLATLGNVLSYARIMALGTASVMLAVVANQMVGAIGSVTVGLLFALLFHLVNFAIGLFSPTIHAMRLHYVEFFGKFYSPGGRRYEPFGRWSPHPGR